MSPSAQGRPGTGTDSRHSAYILVEGVVGRRASLFEIQRKITVDPVQKLRGTNIHCPHARWNQKLHALKVVHDEMPCALHPISDKLLKIRLNPNAHARATPFVALHLHQVVMPTSHFSKIDLAEVWPKQSCNQVPPTSQPCSQSSLQDMAQPLKEKLVQDASPTCMPAAFSHRRSTCAFMIVQHSGGTCRAAVQRRTLTSGLLAHSTLHSVLFLCAAFVCGDGR